MTGVAGIFIESAVNREGKPFCIVEVALEDGATHKAQLDPGEVRKMALDWLQVAEAAVSDAAVFKLLTTELSVETDTAIFTIGRLRNTRSDMPGIEDKQ